MNMHCTLLTIVKLGPLETSSFPEKQFFPIPGRVHTVHVKPRKSWNFGISKSRHGNHGKLFLVVEIHGKLKF